MNRVELPPNGKPLKSERYGRFHQDNRSLDVSFLLNFGFLVPTHFVPVDDPSMTDEMWMEGAKAHFEGKVIVGKDLMEI